MKCLAALCRYFQTTFIKCETIPSAQIELVTVFFLQIGIGSVLLRLWTAWCGAHSLNIDYGLHDYSLLPCFVSLACHCSTFQARPLRASMQSAAATLRLGSAEVASKRP